MEPDDFVVCKTNLASHMLDIISKDEIHKDKFCLLSHFPENLGTIGLGIFDTTAGPTYA